MCHGSQPQGQAEVPQRMEFIPTLEKRGGWNFWESKSKVKEPRELARVAGANLPALRLTHSQATERLCSPSSPWQPFSDRRAGAGSQKSPWGGPFLNSLSGENYKATEMIFLLSLIRTSVSCIKQDSEKKYGWLTLMLFILCLPFCQITAKHLICQHILFSQYLMRWFLRLSFPLHVGRNYDSKRSID